MSNFEMVKVSATTSIKVTACAGNDATSQPLTDGHRVQAQEMYAERDAIMLSGTQGIAAMVAVVVVAVVVFEVVVVALPVEGRSSSRSICGR